MKKSIITLSLLAVGLLGMNKSKAQVSIQLNIGGVFSAAISSAPTVPSMMADQASYYYYDDIDCYYDVNQGYYIYPYNNVWYYSQQVPSMFQNYDFSRGRHSMLDRQQFQQRNIRPNAMNDNDRPTGMNSPMRSNWGSNNPMISRNNQDYSRMSGSNRNNIQEPTAMSRINRNDQQGNFRNNNNGRNATRRNDNRY